MLYYHFHRGKFDEITTAPTRRWSICAGHAGTRSPLLAWRRPRRPQMVDRGVRFSKTKSAGARPLDPSPRICEIRDAGCMTCCRALYLGDEPQRRTDEDDNQDTPRRQNDSVRRGWLADSRRRRRK